MARNEPRIVAELGRPETPEETAARRAEASRLRRENQTTLNLVIALVASLAIVLFLVVVVVRPDQSTPDPVDYVSLAADAGATVPLAAPTVPTGWSANAARYGEVAGIPTWYVGFVTASTQFIALNQGLDANPSWTEQVLDAVAATGSTTIGGVTWSIHDNRSGRDVGNHAYALTAEIGGSTIVLHGTASDEEFAQLAAAVVADLGGR